VIKSFADKLTAAVFAGEQAKKLPPEIQQTARRKLKLIDAATSLDALRVPPSNRLELLKGDRKGQYSIRINPQWRICFRWEKDGAADVEIVDYH
jgi:proteic killer suppression protein